MRKPLVDIEDTKQWVREIVKALGMKIVIGPYAHYCTAKDNNGITGGCNIETSHVSLHCWDKTNPPLFRFDVYSCATFDSRKVIDMINEKVDPTQLDYIILDRNHMIKNLTPKTHRLLPFLDLCVLMTTICLIYWLIV